MRTKLLLLATAAFAIGLPAIAQEVAQTQPAPANRYPNGGIGATGPQAQPQPSTAPSTLGGDTSGGADETAVEEISSTNLQPLQPVQSPHIAFG